MATSHALPTSRSLPAEHLDATDGGGGPGVVVPSRRVALKEWANNESLDRLAHLGLGGEATVSDAAQISPKPK